MNKKLIVKTTVIVLLLFTIGLQSQDYSTQSKPYIPPELGQIYKYHTGVSLESAIKALSETSLNGAKEVADGVWVRLNGGGLDNKLYIGMQNIIEILVTNNQRISATGSTFEFECPTCLFTWDTTYSSDPDHPILKFHEDAFIDSLGGEPFLFIQVDDRLDTDVDTIGITGVGYVYNTLQPCDTPTRLYSMRVSVPADCVPQEDGFKVKAIWLPPAGKWSFTSIGGLTIIPYPDFQGYSGDYTGCDIPIYFDVAYPDCYEWLMTEWKNSPTTSSSTGLKHPWEDDFKPEDYTVLYYDGGKKHIELDILFDEDENCLKNLGVRICSRDSNGNPDCIVIPIDKIPELIVTDGLKRIKLIPPMESGSIGNTATNYAMDYIKCDHDYNATKYGATGKEVVAEIRTIA